MGGLCNGVRSFLVYTTGRRQTVFTSIHRIGFIDRSDLRDKAWAIAAQNDLTTLYDAAFLACAELFGAEFWTADRVLVNSLSPCPDYIRSLSDN
jgi:predicted nucleic acid-binding protein